VLRIREALAVALRIREVLVAVLLVKARVPEVAVALLTKARIRVVGTLTATVPNRV
jgi:hypothetical protein